MQHTVIPVMRLLLHKATKAGVGMDMGVELGWAAGVGASGASRGKEARKSRRGLYFRAPSSATSKLGPDE